MGGSSGGGSSGNFYTNAYRTDTSYRNYVDQIVYGGKGKQGAIRANKGTYTMYQNYQADQAAQQKAAADKAAADKAAADAKALADAQAAAEADQQLANSGAADLGGELKTAAARKTKVRGATPSTGATIGGGTEILLRKLLGE